MKTSVHIIRLSLLLLFCYITIPQMSAQQSILLGLTSSGGSNSGGTAFSFNIASDSETVLWNFGLGSDGAGPIRNLTYDPQTGLYYAETSRGGSNGVGAIISLDLTTGRDSVLFSFDGTNGSAPYGSLLYNPATGLLYGTSSSGGQYSGGVIYSFDPATGTEQTLWNFGNGTDGSIPWDDMVYNSSTGLYYGMTDVGGDSSQGTLYSFDPVSGRDSVLWSFAAGTGGINPYGNLTYDRFTGLYYGMTSAGGTGTTGTIFSFDPLTNIVTTVWSFTGGSDGNHPEGDFILRSEDSLLYGLTADGGSNSAGTIISFDPATGTERVRWSFGVNSSDGQAPYGNLTYDAGNGMFYGMTELGGAHSDGTIFSFDPAADTEHVEWNFAGGQDGSVPIGSLIFLGTTTGIKTINTEKVSIYPNPTTGIVSLSGLTAGQTIEVYDYLGQRVSSTTADNTTAQINLTSHESGVYMVTVLNSDGSIASEKKMVKEN